MCLCAQLLEGAGESLPLQMHYLRSLIFTPEEVFSRERVRNEIAREKLSRERLHRKREEADYDAEKGRLDDGVRAKREGFAAAARPLLDEFDNTSMAQHYYQEVSNTVASHLRIVSQLADRELSEFGYVSKKLISIGLNCEALKHRMAGGAPFARELSTVLKDSESDDLSLIAAPLHRVGVVPSAAAVRATAFDLARAIEEEAGGGNLPREPVGGWLDRLKFRTLFSPTMLEMRRVRARRAAESFRSHVECGEYRKALELVEDIYADANREGGVANAELFESAYAAFRETVLPTIASDIFLRYSRASLNASRYACVEKLLKE